MNTRTKKVRPTDASRKPTNHLRGFLVALAFIPLVVGYFTIDKTSGQPEVMSGTVDHVKVEVRKMRGTYLVCHIVVSNGAIFEAPCDFKPGARVTVHRFRRRLSGASVYVLRGF